MSKGNSLVFTYEAVTRHALWGLPPANIGISPLIVSYDYRIAKIEEKDAHRRPYRQPGHLPVRLLHRQAHAISDSTLRAVTYGHDSFGNLTTVTGPGVNAASIPMRSPGPPPHERI